MASSFGVLTCRSELLNQSLSVVTSGDISNHRLIKDSQDSVCMRYHTVLIYHLDLTWKVGEQQVVSEKGY